MKKHFLHILITMFTIILASSQLEVSENNYSYNEIILDVDVYPKEVHIVKSGDSLWSLSNEYSTTVRAIKQNNNLMNNIIKTGEEIIIPERIYYITKQNIFEHFDAINSLLEAIYIAEGKDRARVPYGATSFYDNGNKFSHARSQDFFDILTKNCSIGSREYYKAASAVTVLYYWEIYMEKNEGLRGAVFDEVPFNKQIDFIHYLGSQYAPVSASHLNKNWIKNVVYYFNLINDRSRPLL